MDQKLMEETDKNILDRLDTINAKMGIDTSQKHILNCKDIFLIVKYLVQLMSGIGEIDDIDHFGNISFISFNLNP
ncbi:unnamed protein product [marine sediment metagenome]|uniref:RNA polymerase Rpb2 domain-containing protein n=1 Tax=marine sediment metagenome TaxID=412755 RepID=X1BK63_9ZZZZ